MEPFEWLKNLIARRKHQPHPNEPERLAHQEVSNETLLQASCLKSDWQSILPLSSLLLSGDQTIARSADAAIASRVSRLSPHEYLRLDEAMRETLDYRYMVQVDQIARLTNLSVSHASLGIMSFSGNGHVRQVAVEKLAKINDGSEIPFLLIRLTDWVVQIAQRAATAIDKRLTPENTHHFVPYLALLHLLNNRRRAKTFQISKTSIDKVMQLMKSQQAVPALLQALSNSPEKATRRACLEYLLNINGVDILDVSRTALQNPDAQLRRIAINGGCNRLPADEAIPLLKQACNDKSPGVRADSLRCLAETKPAEAIQIIHDLLLDRSASVRELTRYYIKKFTPETDILDFYKNCIAEQKALPIAIAAIADVGSAKDAPLIAPFLNSGQNPRSRKAAIKSIAHLDGSRYSEDIANAITAPEPEVSRAATIALARYMHIVDNDKIWKIFEDSDVLPVKLNCLRLLNKSEKWARITYLLHALQIDSTEIQNCALTNIHNWLATYRTTWQYTMPTHDQSRRFQAALQHAAPQLPPPVLDFLQVCANTMSES